MSATPLRLFLVRHGEAAANVDMRYLGSRDDPLTPRGALQARQVARALAERPISAVWTSPLRRAADTAMPIAREHGLTSRTDERLREGSFGEWEGLTRIEVLRRSEQDQLALAQWENNPRAAPPGGESLQSVQVRVLELVQELASVYSGKEVILVSHVGPIKALLCAALQVPLTTAYHMFLDPATISVVDWSATSVVRLFNAHEHLGPSARWMERY